MFDRKLIVLTAMLSAAWTSVAQTAHPVDPAPAYEVTTVKLWNGSGFAVPLGVYIKGAFGILPNVTGRVIGPDWVNSTRYVIQGKPPDSIRDAMQTMTPGSPNGTETYSAPIRKAGETRPERDPCGAPSGSPRN